MNRSTVILAYEELRASGIIESAKGSGTKVTKHKWGITPKQTPNWKTYVEGGTFLPNLPFIRRIREDLLSPGDAVAIEDPSYCYSLPMFQSAGLRLFRLPVDDEGMNPEIQPEASYLLNAKLACPALCQSLAARLSRMIRSL